LTELAAKVVVQWQAFLLEDVRTPLELVMVQTRCCQVWRWSLVPDNMSQSHLQGDSCPTVTTCDIQRHRGSLTHALRAAQDCYSRVSKLERAYPTGSQTAVSVTASEPHPTL